MIIVNLVLKYNFPFVYNPSLNLTSMAFISSHSATWPQIAGSLQIHVTYLELCPYCCSALIHIYFILYNIPLLSFQAHKSLCKIILQFCI